MFFSRLILLIPIAFLWVFIPRPSLAQAAPGVRETRTSSSSQSTFSYKIQTTYGTSTSAQVSGNMRADNEAVLKLKSGTIITNKMGGGNGDSSAVFVATPNGGSVTLSGMSGENMFLIDDGTYFKSKLYTDDNLDPSLTSTGNASATATHTTIVTVERGSTTFQNTFQQTY